MERIWGLNGDGIRDGEKISSTNIIMVGMEIAFPTSTSSPVIFCTYFFLF